MQSCLIDTSVMTICVISVNELSNKMYYVYFKKGFHQENITISSATGVGIKQMSKNLVA
jgi:hypothetical protein